MKRQVQQTGIRKYFGADLIDLQGEPLKVLDSLFAEYGPCVIQGCEPSVAEDGSTYDIAPGLVALRAADPEGVERVMAMPFGGARGVSLPAWLVPQQTIQERVYGDGKVKPVAHSYAAVVTASQPEEGVSSLQVTGRGAPRLVDVLQDASHRFVSDADRAKWDARVSAAQLAEALAAKADTDHNHTAVEVGAIPTNVVAHSLAEFNYYTENLIDGIIELQTSETVFGDLGAVVHRMNRWAAGWEAVQLFMGQSSNTLKYRRIVNGVAQPPVDLWHSGNFDPSGKADVTTRSFHGGIAAAPFAPGIAACDVAGIEFSSILTMPGYSSGYATQLRIRDYAGSTEASIRGEQSKQWYGLWHTGNFDPAATLRDLGQRVDISQCHLGMGFQYDTGGSGTTGSYLSFGNAWYPIEMTAGYWGGSGGHHNLKFRTYNGDNHAWNPWHTVYCDANLGPASASADGLMTAADKQKLDSLSSARRCCGIIDSNGTFGGAAGIVSVTKQGAGKYMVTHNFNSIKYAVVATPFALWTGNDAADARFVCTIKQRLENHFTIHVFDINRNACVDQAFMFIVMPTE